MPTMLEIKVLQDIVWMLYDWGLSNYKEHTNKISIAEMCMLRWMYGKTCKDKIRNENIRDIKEYHL